METISLILNLLLGSGLGFLTMMFFYTSKKRQASAQASSAEVNVKRENLDVSITHINFLQEQLEEAYDNIVKAQNIINTEREKVVALTEQVQQLQIALLNERTLRAKERCVKECTERDPPIIKM